MLFDYLTLNPAAPERGEFSHILVDEYQDLNRAEQQVIELLGAGGEICIIGDDDQSVYSFKHAHPAGIREWGPACGGEDHQIMECRRCPTTIVEMANALIARNQDRQPRAMVPRPENGPGTVTIRQFQTAGDEANAIADDIQRLIDEGVPPGDIIVLSQRKTFASPIYTLLRQRGIPAKSYYAEMPLSTKAAQERFAILKLFLNNEDRVALRWLLGCQHNRWHASQYGRVSTHVVNSGVSPWATMCALADGDIAIPNTGTLVDRFKEIRDELDQLGNADALDEFTGWWLPPDEQTALLTQAVVEHSENVENVQELFEALQQEFTQPEIPLEVAEVRLMSFHKCKGLSSPNVYITGCVEGLIPSRPPHDATQAEARAKLEEDRRLFYVAMTRVKAVPGGSPGYLHISYPRTMGRAEAMQNNIAAAQLRGLVAYLQGSRFLAELGPHAPQPQAG